LLASDWRPVGDIEAAISLVASESRVGEGRFLHCQNPQDHNEERCLFKVAGQATWCNDRGRGETPRYERQKVPVAGQAAPVAWSCLPEGAGEFIPVNGDNLSAIFIPADDSWQKVLVRAQVQGEPSPPDAVPDVRVQTVEWEADNPNDYLTLFRIGIRVIAVGPHGLAPWTEEDGGKDVSESGPGLDQEIVNGDFHAAAFKPAFQNPPVPPVIRDPKPLRPEHNTFYAAYYAESSNAIFHPICTGKITTEIGFRVTGPQVHCRAGTSGRWFWRSASYVLEKVGPILVNAGAVAAGPYGPLVEEGAGLVLDACISYTQNLAGGLNARAAFLAYREVNGVVNQVRVDARFQHWFGGERYDFSRGPLGTLLSGTTLITGNPKWVVMSRFGVESGAGIICDGYRDTAAGIVCAATQGVVHSTQDPIPVQAAFLVSRPSYHRPVTLPALRPEAIGGP
jgi:hypothetical protein